MDELTSDRLLLRPLSQDEAQAVVAADRSGRRWSPGYPGEPDTVIAGLVLRTPPADEGDVLFGTWQVIDRESGLVVGGVGFRGPPDADGRVEIGYGMVPEVRGRGVATEAVATLLARVAGEPGLRTVVASADLDNPASMRVLEKNGLVTTGSDEKLRHYARTCAAAG